MGPGQYAMKEINSRFGAFADAQTHRLPKYCQLPGFSTNMVIV